ncbi:MULTISPECIES: hypothetical protein [Vibrio]|uniref:hypothetical protein n=1 Tax=Vibrio TaxID=662 RepID=UPI001C126EF3|nr:MULTISPECIES: hypothetical protein [Vibrio]MDW3103472.1 hypothetical protein [Vibrio sp. 1874]MDW3201519.1 hypothetical protein [Vibrio sp. 1865]WED62287.1 hypothetical protein O6P42_18270 [Vibrio alginolyticus]
MLTHIERARCKTNVHGVGCNQRYSSSGRCGGIEVHGPYKTADEACKAATAKYGVTKLTSPMLIF